jgi:hypothetical protein
METAAGRARSRAQKQIASLLGVGLQSAAACVGFLCVVRNGEITRSITGLNGP